MIKSRLYITIFVSAILHLAALTLWWHGQQNIMVSTIPQGSPLNVSINQTVTKQEQTKQSFAEHSKRNLKSTLATSSPRKVSEPKNETVQASAKDFIEEVKNINEQQVNDQAQELALLSNNMVDYLNTEFKLRFKYPMLARKRGWQGEVLLGLDINRHGEIAHVVIQRSSGYKILDHNAVKTFELIGAVSPKLSTEIISDHHLSIPVIYKLTGS